MTLVWEALQEHGSIWNQAEGWQSWCVRAWIVSTNYSCTEGAGCLLLYMDEAIQGRQHWSTVVPALQACVLCHTFGGGYG